VRSTLAKVLSATFGLAALLIVLEHAGGFSKVLESGAGAYATGFAAITGHATPAKASGVSYRKA
jgi:hypothetical protein